MPSIIQGEGEQERRERKLGAGGDRKKLGEIERSWGRENWELGDRKKQILWSLEQYNSLENSINIEPV